MAGCNTGPQMQRDLYNRELRIQEDEIYRLEECLEECHAVIRQMRKENADLRMQTDAGVASGTVLRAEPIDPGRRDSKPDDDDERSLLDSGDWSPERPAPEPPAERPPVEDAPEIELPTIDGGQPAEAPPFSPTPSSAPAETLPGIDVPTGPESLAPPVNDPPVPLPGAEPGGLPEAPPFSNAGPVASKLVAKCRPGVIEADGGPTMVITAQPLDPSGEPIEFAGAAGVLLRNPAAPPAKRVIAQWDYTADELAAAWVGPVDDRKLVLHVVAPPSTPFNRPLDVWVRLLDAAGAQLLARATIEKAQSAVASGIPSDASDDDDPPPPMLAELKRSRVVLASAEDFVADEESAEQPAMDSEPSDLEWQALGGAGATEEPEPATAERGWTRRATTS
ncbi:MAG: hypothetical protein AAGJ46_01510 [Planctomycetota bacterium]